MVDAWTAAHAADLVYDSMDGLAAAWHASMASLTAMPTFHAWQRDNPTFKPQLSGALWTPKGPRRVTVLLDTGATHCFICARLAVELGLRPSGHTGPTSVSTAATGAPLGLLAPVLIHLSLGDTFREALSVSPMDMDVGADLILGWDWISSHDLHHLYADGQVRLRSGPTQLQLDLLPAGARPAARTLQVMGHGDTHTAGDGPLPDRREPTVAVAVRRTALDKTMLYPSCKRTKLKIAVRTVPNSNESSAKI